MISLAPPPLLNKLQPSPLPCFNWIIFIGPGKGTCFLNFFIPGSCLEYASILIHWFINYQNSLCSASMWKPRKTSFSTTSGQCGQRIQFQWTSFTWSARSLIFSLDSLPYTYSVKLNFIFLKLKIDSWNDIYASIHRFLSVCHK